MKVMFKGIRVNLLWDLAPQLDQYLRQSQTTTTTLQPQRTNSFLAFRIFSGHRY
jgi:hypothetical protein